MSNATTDDAKHVNIRLFSNRPAGDTAASFFGLYG